MAIRSFDVAGLRGLEYASAQDLPNVVAISGSNGSGKSALLELVWQNRSRFLEAGSTAMYVGPSRSWRKGSLNNVAVLGLTAGYSDTLMQDTMPSWQYGSPGGLNWMAGQQRITTGADDSQALVKTAIVKIQNRFQENLASEFYRQGGRIAAGSVENALSPLTELVGTLLPHLEFYKIDSANQDDIKVYFRSSDDVSVSPKLFDIDDLSSGEKAAIALFMPFVERKANRIISRVEQIHNDLVPLTVLLDEPEIHLHPMLQLNMLEYIREIAARNEAQFIFTTHSPTMLDGLEPDELYLLSPASMAPENQLSKLSLSIEKLDLARTITGSTHILTRSKPILVIEGEKKTTKKASDERLLKLLIPQAEHWAIVPMQGKGQVIKAVDSLQDSGLNIPGSPVFGLVDADQQRDTPDRIIQWPVSMIENLLLDAASIAKLLQPYSNTSGRSKAAITTLLESIVMSQKEDEVSLRVMSKMPSKTLRARGSSGPDIQATLRQDYNQFQAEVDAIDIDTLFATARREVEEIIDSGSALEKFRGKAILTELYRRLNVNDRIQMSYSVFVTELARHVGSSTRLKTLTKEPLSKVTLYFPSELTDLIGDSSATNRSAVAAYCRAERQRWEAGRPTSRNRETKRKEIFDLAREIKSTDMARAEKIMGLASTIGTP